MNFLNNYDLVTAVNLFVNLGIFGIAICRSGKLKKQDTLFRVRIQYIILAPAAFANAFAPTLFQEWTNRVAVVFSLVILIMLVLDSWQWKTGAPTSVKTDFADLNEILPEEQPK